MSISDRSVQVVERAPRIARHALAVLLVTCVHHVYGAYIYQTPWRYHAVFVSAGATLAIVGSLALLRARDGTVLGQFAWWMFVLTTVAVPVLMIGTFEGLYNHVVKDVLYFAGAPADWMTRLFPPPTYEMPNDAFFEITGVLQVVPAATTAWLLWTARARSRG